MDEISPADVDTWIEAVSTLYADHVTDEDMRAADHAAGLASSGLGFMDAPMQVLTMLSQATAVGYALALKDLREGDLDDEIESSRPVQFLE